jgi:putative oxidoreductase
MKIAVLIARILLGLEFVFFGLNAFFHYLPQPELPKDASGQFIGALFSTHYGHAVAAVQVIGGVLLIIGRYIPLALTLLGPVLVNILFFHLFMAPKQLPNALVSVLLWFIIFYGVRHAFAGIFAEKVPIAGR